MIKYTRSIYFVRSMSSSASARLGGKKERGSLLSSACALFFVVLFTLALGSHISIKDHPSELNDEGDKWNSIAACRFATASRRQYPAAAGREHALHLQRDEEVSVTSWDESQTISDNKKSDPFPTEATAAAAPRNEKRTVYRLELLRQQGENAHPAVISDINNVPDLPSAENSGNLPDFFKLKGVRMLTDAKWESFLFPSAAEEEVHTHRPYFIMLYSPTCTHCKELIPQFDKAAQDIAAASSSSSFLSEDCEDDNNEHFCGNNRHHNDLGLAGGHHQAAIQDLHVKRQTNDDDDDTNNKPNPFAPQFALINTLLNPRLAELFQAKASPAFVYSIGGHVYPFLGSPSAEGFARMAYVLAEAYRYNNPQLRYVNNEELFAREMTTAVEAGGVPSANSVCEDVTAREGKEEEKTKNEAKEAKGEQCGEDRTSLLASSTRRTISTELKKLMNEGAAMRPPLSIPVRDITSYDRSFLPFWRRLTAYHPTLNPMGSATARTSAFADVGGGATTTGGPSSLYGNFTGVADGGLNFGVIPPLFIVCQPPPISVPHASTSSSSGSSSSQKEDLHYYPSRGHVPRGVHSVRRPAFATFIESVLSTGRSQFATIVAQPPDDEARKSRTDLFEREMLAQSRSGSNDNVHQMLTAYQQNPRHVHATLLAACTAAFTSEPGTTTTTTSRSDGGGGKSTPSPLRRRSPSVGPNREVLFLYSPDRSLKPIFYHGFSDGQPNGPIAKKKWAGDGVADVAYSEINASYRFVVSSGASSSDDSFSSSDENHKEKKLVLTKGEGEQDGANKTITLTLTHKIMITNQPSINEEPAVRSRLEPLTSVVGAPTFRTSRALALWIWENSYNMIEYGSNDVLTALPRRLRIGVFVLPAAASGSVDHDRAILSLPDSQQQTEEQDESIDISNDNLVDGNASDEKLRNPPPDPHHRYRRMQRHPSAHNVVHNITSYYPGLNWLARKRYLAYRNLHRNAYESSVALSVLQENRRWPMPNPPGMRIVSIAQTDFDSAMWMCRWQNTAPMQIIVVSALTHKGWLHRIGASVEHAGAPKKAVPTATDISSAEPDPNVPYFFAYDAANNKMALMKNWLIPEKQRIMAKQRTPQIVNVTLLHRPKQMARQKAGGFENEKEKGERRGIIDSEGLFSLLPTASLSSPRKEEEEEKEVKGVAHYVPPSFEPRNGIALKLIDQFMNDFCEINNQGEDFNVAGDDKEGNEDKSNLEATLILIPPSSSVFDSPFSTSLSKVADSNNNGNNNDNNNKESSLPLAENYCAEEEEDEEGSKQHNAAATADAPILIKDAHSSSYFSSSSSRKRLRIEHTSRSAAMVSTITAYVPFTDRVLQTFCGDDHFFFLLSLLVAFVGVGAVVAAFAGGQGVS